MSDDTPRGIIAADVSGNIPEKVWPDDENPIFYLRSVNLLAGPSGMGKSTAMQKVAADLSRTLGPGIYCNFEDDTVMQAFRLSAAGADMSKVMLAKHTMPDGAWTLQKAIMQQGAKWFIADTAAKFFRGAHITKWDGYLEQLHCLLESTDCMGLLVHHTLRGAKANADWRLAVGGTTGGPVGTSRSVSLFGIALDDPDTMMIAPVKDSYDAPPPAIRLERRTEEIDQEDGQTVQVQCFGIIEKGIHLPNPAALVVLTGKGEGPSKGPPPEKAAEAAEFLTTALATGCRAVKDSYRCLTNPDGAAGQCGFKAVGEVEKNQGACPDCSGAMQATAGLMSDAEAAGVAWGTIKRAKDALTIVTARKGFGGGGIFYWRLPDGHPSLNTDAPTELP